LWDICHCHYSTRTTPHSCYHPLGCIDLGAQGEAGGPGHPPCYGLYFRSKITFFAIWMRYGPFAGVTGGRNIRCEPIRGAEVCVRTEWKALLARRASRRGISSTGNKLDPNIAYLGTYGLTSFTILLLLFAYLT